MTSIAEPEPVASDPAYYLLDRVFETLAYAVAEGLATESAMRAAILAHDNQVDPSDAVELASYGDDQRVRDAGDKRNALVKSARRAMQAREYGEDGAA